MRRRPELAAVLLAALAAGCAAPAPTAAPAGSATPAVSSTPTLVPVHIVSSGNGSSVTVSEIKRRRKIYTIRARSFTADTAAGQSATGSGEFEQPHITFLDHSGAQTVADAPKAVLTSADKSVLMTGGVQARSQDGNVLSCDRLRYDGTTERIHGEGHVVLRTPTGLMLVGDEIDGDARLQNVRVYRR
jgi:lipopolysaccharide assembly outer membrane protein LptD (OstA)